MEIERKFLVTSPPDLTGFPVRHLEQAYLCREPVVRVRRSEDGCVLTCKGPGLLAREEWESPLSRECYDRLLGKAEGQILSKSRFRIPLGPHTVELDCFAPPLAPLMLAEVEFSSLEAAAPAETAPAAIRPGRYRHFKGREYQLLCTARHSETEELMVVYRALYGEGGLWVRPAAMWEETVTRDGVTVRRFTYVDA